jgi:two-component system, OmpR family, phosphate regulon sensor histidine kinase PhoR
MLAALDANVVLVLIGTALIVGVVAVLWFFFSRSLRDLSAGAERFARGDLSQKVAVTGPLQMAALADALNRMADQLRERLATVVQQRNELGAVLASMTEGVLAVDQDEQVISLNPAAARMLGAEPAVALGRSIQEVVRNTALQRCIAEVLEGDNAVQASLTLRPDIDASGNGSGHAIDRIVEVHATPLRDADGRRIGALIVLNDTTRLRRLESVRQDFVANVSHEIKTPVTAIKAAAETLMQEGDQAREDTHRFLQIVARQADRLHAIIEDLLSLAKIEQDAKNRTIELIDGRIIGVLRSAIETCQARADAKSITVELDCESDLDSKINAPLLEQAVVNLLDNAIKYSPDGSPVRVSAGRSEGEVVITVQDEGSGIEADHLPRLFERFYRTDKARSRALGGTGLGLAIVKHIAQAHGGRVSVDSTTAPSADHGSTFRVHVPAG